MRAKNLTGREHCRYCDGSGWVVFDAGTPEKDRERWQREIDKLPKGKQQLARCSLPIRGEAMAPCPRCEQGYANEFPGKDAAGRDIRLYGEDGFWQGRREETFQLAQRNTTPLPRAENLRRLQELFSQLKRLTEAA